MNSPQNNVRHLLLLFIALSIGAMLDAQSTCEVWQWNGTDSVNKTLVKAQQLNAYGLVTYEKVTGYIYNPRFAYPDNSEAFYEYEDTLLMRELVAIPDLDSFRFEYRYDSAGKLIYRNYWVRRYFLLDTVKSGMFTISSVATDPTDGKWVLKEETVISYNERGQQVYSLSKTPEGNIGATYTWAYDGAGRISKFAYSFRDVPCYTETAEHFEGGYRFIRTCFTEKGKRIRRVRKNSPPFMQEKTFTTKLDAYGRISEERIDDTKGRLFSRTVRSYNSKGKIARIVYYDAEDKVTMTHVYVYK